jgi:hypothetical protein
MTEPGEKHYLTFELPPGTPSEELLMALGSLRRVVAASGGQVHEYVVLENMDVMTDTGLRNTARCVAYMRDVGLLDPDRLIADLTIGSDPPERFGSAETFRGLNKTILNDLTAGPEDSITTVPVLLAMTDVGLMGRKMGPKKIALLRETLVASGMPQAYPWPQSERVGKEPALLRSVALLAPTLEELPDWTRTVLTEHLLGIHIPKGEEVPRQRVAEASVAYSLQREEVLRIVRA